LSRVALFWFTADGPYGVPEWGFAVDTMDVLRFVVMALLVGVYGALWLHARQQGPVSGWRASASRSGGVVGAFASVRGLSTGPCSARLPRLAGRAGPASELVGRDLQVSCRQREPLVVSSKLDGLALGSQEFHRGQVQGVQRSDRPRERLQRPGQHGRGQLHEGNASDQRAHGFTVRAGQPPPMNPCPYLVLEQATRGQWLTPETLRD